MREWLRSIERLTWLKVAITVVALLCIAARLIWPNLKIDAITLGLLIVAVLPWLAALIKSAEFPGGWKIEFQDVQQAGAKVTEGAEATGPAEATATNPSTLSFLSVANQDPNLALVALRIEIEQRVRQLAERNDVNSRQPLSRIVDQLRRAGILNDSSVSGLQELIMAGNSAAHGARVEPSAANWAFEYGPNVLAALDSKLRPHNPPLQADTGRGRSRLARALVFTLPRTTLGLLALCG